MLPRCIRRPALTMRLLLLAAIATAALAGRAGATCPEFPPPPNPVLRTLDDVRLVVAEEANPVAPQHRMFTGVLPDGTGVPRLFLEFAPDPEHPGSPSALEAQVLAALAPDGDSLALVGDYAESVIVCGVAGGMHLHTLRVTGLVQE